MIALVLVAALSAAIGFVTGRWIAAPLPAALWVLQMVGRRQGWWGSGVGDGWEIALVGGAALVAGAATVGVLARRGLRRAA